MTSSLFNEHAKHLPASGPLHLLGSMPGGVFSQICILSPRYPDHTLPRFFGASAQISPYQKDLSIPALAFSTYLTALYFLLDISLPLSDIQYSYLCMAHRLSVNLMKTGTSVLFISVSPEPRIVMCPW